MNCWEILGIEPTGDRDQIRQAYERQLKFASDDEARRLDEAYREATGTEPVVSARSEPERGPEPMPERELDASEAQVVREVVIQVKALMNDHARQQDAGIWKAILCEPPADQLPLRRELARQLEPQIRPMAENGSFPVPVARFLGEWFDWFSVQETLQEPDPRTYPESDMTDVAADEMDTDQQPQMVNFWPAVIGWVIGLAILTALFGGMGG